MTDNSESLPSGEQETSVEATSKTLGAWDEDQVGFYGNPKIKLDDRGRLKLPAEFKTFAEKKYGKNFNAFYITSREGLDAEIYPMPEWQQHLAKVFGMPKSLPARKKLLERYTLYGDRIFSDYESRFLKKHVQTGLFLRISEGVGRGNFAESSGPDEIERNRTIQPVYRAGCGIAHGIRCVAHIRFNPSGGAHDEFD